MDETSERKRKRDEESDPSAPPSKQFGKKVWIETPKLVAIFKEIEEFAGKIELEKNEGATEDELTAFENETKMEIPKELRDLLKYSNGLRISYCLPLKKEEGEEKKGEGEEKRGEGEEKKGEGEGEEKKGEGKRKKEKERRKKEKERRRKEKERGEKTKKKERRRRKRKRRGMTRFGFHQLVRCQNIGLTTPLTPLSSLEKKPFRLG